MNEDLLINCSYKQWEAWACNNPPVCSNSFGFVSCIGIADIIILIATTFGLSLFFFFLHKITKEAHQK